MPTKRLKVFLYLLSALAVALAFVIKLLLDGIYKNAAQGISASLALQMLFSSIALTLFGFFICMYSQYRTKNKRKVLACAYDQSSMCCLLNSGLTHSLFGDDSEIVDDVELAKYEREIVTNAIWLLSPDLSCEEGDNVFKEVVRSRLNEGVHYSFIALDSPISRERATRIWNEYKTFFTKKKMHFYLIDGEEYSLFLSLYSIAIYDPFNNAGGTCAYVCIGETEGSDTSIYAKINRAHTQIATNITREIIRTTREFVPR